MNSKTKRDEKDPMPNAYHSFRVGGDGNTPVDVSEHVEDHDSKKAETITGDRRFTLRTGGEMQPTRQNGGGNEPVTGEDHGQAKAERITGAQRGGENTAGDLANSPGR
jgi:hypothetical protein